MDTFNQELKCELNVLWTLLNKKSQYAGKLAPPFYGYAPDTFHEANVKILYIGKATAGAPEPEEYQAIFEGKKSAFWQFARRLCDSTGASLAWSNLCKIGTLEGNPDKNLAKEQMDLDVRILKEEIRFLKPCLIVCVAADTVYDDFVYCALETMRGPDGFIGKPDEDNAILWVRPGGAGYPPILWMRHPERKTSDYLDYAESEALQLLGLGRS